jgi:NTE family protein
MVRKGGLTGLLGLVPAGVTPTPTLRRFPIGRLNTWPVGLWIPAVRVGDGEVVVFGRDRTDVSIGDALEATSAVPGKFRPKEIDGDRFMGGAVASATHADLLAGDGFDTVIVSSPITRPPAPGKRNGPVRRRAQRQLDREVATLRSMGTKVLVLTPDQAVLTAADGAATVAAARRQTARAIQEQPVTRGR